LETVGDTDLAISNAVGRRDASITDCWCQVLNLQRGDLGLLATFMLLSEEMKLGFYCKGIVWRPRISCNVVIWVIKVLQ
jgi:hypothetical protein